MESTPPADLSLLIEALTNRIDREIGRAAGTAAPSTEMVGGWAKLGGLVDTLLRNTFTALCLENGVDPDATFRACVGQEAWALTRASAGQLRAAVVRVGRTLHTRDARLRRVVLGAADQGGPLASAIATRNAVVHVRGAYDRAASLNALRAMRAWVATLEA